MNIMNKLPVLFSERILNEIDPDVVVNMFKDLDPSIDLEEQASYIYTVMKNPILITHIDQIFDIFIQKRFIHRALSYFLDCWIDYWTTNIFHRSYPYYADRSRINSLRQSIYKMLRHLGNEDFDPSYNSILLADFNVTMEGTG